MAIYKQIVFLCLGILIVACHSVTQDELTGVGLAPDPVFNKFRTLVVAPIYLPDGDRKSDYIWLGTELENTVFNYLQFLNTIPGNIENVIVDNASDIWDFYGISQPNKAKQVEMLEKTIRDNQDHWNKITPEDREELMKRYQIPSELQVSTLQGKKTALSYLDQNFIVVQLTLSKNFLFKCNIYDPVSTKTLIEWEIALPKDINRGNDPDQKLVEKQLKAKLYNTMQVLSQKPVAEMTIPSITNDMSVFIDGKMILTPSIYLTHGNHQVYVSQLGDIVQGGSIEMTRSGELDIEKAIKNQKGQKIVLRTTPDHTPIFINEKYVGLSPVSLTLPEGVHYIRASTLGYAHLNYILKVDPYQPIRELSLDLQLNDRAYENRIKTLRKLKLGTFYSGVLSFGALLYAYERANFYQNKVSLGLDTTRSSRRYNQFMVAQYVLGGIGGGLVLTALIAQILEYQARDVGIGVDEDGNLGVSYRF